MEVLRKLTDKQLHERCKMAGLNARKWLKSFAGLLPEVARRELYRKYGYHDIFEYGAKLAGMRREVISEILRVHSRVVDKPALRQLFEQGQHGWTKIKAVSDVATKDTDGLWAKRIAQLPKSSIEELAKDERRKSSDKTSQEIVRPGADLATAWAGLGDKSNRAANQVNLFGTSADTQPDVQERRSLTVQLKADVYGRLLDFKTKIEKKRGHVVDYNEMIETLLDGHDYEREGLIPYQEIVHICGDCKKTTLKSSYGNVELGEEDLAKRTKVGKTIVLEDRKDEVVCGLKDKKKSRYIPAGLRDVINLEHGSSCAFPGCSKPAKELHHTHRFALDGRLDPDVIKPLCKLHHQLCHSSAVLNEHIDTSNWQLSLIPTGTIKKQRIDDKVISHRL